MKTFFKVLLGVALSAVLLFSLAAASVIILSSGVSLDADKLTSAKSSVEIYDGEGNLIKEVSLTTNSLSVKSEDIPLKTKEAFIAVEDKRFFTHRGLDFKRILSAALKNAKSFSFKEGASTITQQLIKNTHLSGEKTLSRKLKEMRLSLQAERKYSKDEILEMYLNTIYFGHNCFGIAKAARYYFDKEVSDLNVAESAVLAGLIKSPNNYSPIKNKENCVLRRNFVLGEMKNLGYITEEEFAEAKEESLSLRGNGEVCSAYSSEVLNEAENLLGKDAFYSGIKIYTYLDVDLQKSVENLRDDYESDKTYIVEDNESGGITAFYTTATASLKRLPGSVIKPLLVYAPALEDGLISPATPINDEKINYGGYSPKNFGGKFLGYISARRALSESVNVPAVKILNEVGIKKACFYAEKMGLKIEEKDMSLALALGGMSEGFSLKDLVSAYSSFSREGAYVGSAFIDRIENKNGETIFIRNDKREKVFSPETTALINDMLKTAAKEGTAKKLKDFSFDLCAKTGTCESGDKNTDAYAVSYTSKNTVGVWLGNLNNHEITSTGGGVPCMINEKICRLLYNNSSPENFKKCDGIVELTMDKEEYDKNHKLVLADDNAPKKETFKEIFSLKYSPKTKSDRFSHPTFYKKPTIEYSDNTISIVLCQREYTTYCVERADDNGRKERYIVEGTFVDGNIEKGKIYTYTITPYLNKLSGEAVVLPSISTKDAVEENVGGEESILNRDWWNE